MEQWFVTHDGERFPVTCHGRRQAVSINTHDIENIADIEGLDDLDHLVILDLSDNNIRRIEGLEKHEHLEMLDLSDNNISRIEGLDSIFDREGNSSWYYSPKVNSIRSIKKMLTTAEKIFDL